MADVKVSFEKLNDNNFAVWKFKTELFLVKEELFSVVVEDKPGTPTADWTLKDGKARAMIGLAVEDTQLVHIIRKTTAKEMWDSLKKIHEESSLSSTLHVLRKLCSMRLSEEGNLLDHLNDMTALHNQLEVMGEGLKDRVFMALILSSLPMSYGSLINVIESRPEAEVTVEFVKSKLREEWRRRQVCGGGAESSEKALKIMGGKNKFEKKKKSVVCHHCHQPGHFQRDCPKRKEQSDRDKVKDTGKANMVAEVSSGVMEMCLVAATPCESGKWYLDSGATSHMTSDVKLLNNVDRSKSAEICLADGTCIKSGGSGTGKVASITGSGVRMNVTLNDVYHVPSLAGNLLSVGKICDLGYSVVFEKTGCRVLRDKEAVLVGERSGGLYRLKQFPEQALASTVNHPELCEHLWHRRLGHRDPEAVTKIVRHELGFGLKLQKCSVNCVCGVCLKGKMSRSSFPKQSQSKSSAVGDLVHSDVGGPMEVATPSGNRFYVTLVDDYSGYTVVYLLKAKSEVDMKVREYCSLVKNQFGRYPRIIRTDGGGEYSSTAFKQFLAENGIVLQQTTPYSPQQNGKAERKNRYEVEMVRCLLLESGLEKRYWGEALNTANYLQNRLPSSVREKTPYELWHGKKPSYVHLRVFGSEAYVHVPKEKRRKLDPKAVKLVFVGYAEGRKAYHFLNPENDTILISRDAKFVEVSEEEVPHGRQEGLESPEDKVEVSVVPEMKKEEVVISLEGKKIEEIVPVPGAEESSDEEEPDEEQLDVSEYSVASEGSFHGFPMDEIARRSQRSTKGIAPRRLIEEIFVAGTLPPEEEMEPRTLQEAFSCEKSAEWRRAMMEELRSHEENGTWKLVDPPPGRKPVGCKWVYKIKRNAAGEAVKYKARLVAQGFNQKYGQDYDEVFAPVIKQTTLRTLLAIASKRNLILKHFDVKTAYLYGTLEEELYMRQPGGFEVAGQERKVCKLVKSIYGLKQSARCWNHRLHAVLLGLKFKQSRADPCLYTKVVNGRRIYLLVYVDDILIGCDSEEEIEKVYAALSKEFEMANLGDANYFLGMEVRKEGGSWVGAFLAVGAFCGALPAGYLAEKIGRKYTTMSLALPYLVSWALIIFASGAEMLYAGRFVIGIATGASCVVAPMFISEIAETSIRGALGAFFQLFLTVGILFVYAVGPYTSWTTLSVLCAIFPVLLIVAMLIVPESPTYLVKQGRRSDAAAALKWFWGPNCNTQNAVESIQADLDAVKGEAKVSDLFTKLTNRNALFIALLLMFFQQFSGINAVIFYTVPIFQSAGSTMDPAICGIVVGVVQVLMTFVSAVLIDKAGRRILLLQSSFIMGSCLVVLGVYFKLQNDKADVSGIGWLPLASVVLFIISFSLGFGPIPWMMMGELCAPDVKGLASALAVMFNWTLVFLVTKTFGTMQEMIGSDWTFWFFGFWMAICTLYVFIKVPETKGKTNAEIQALLGGKN